MRTRTLVLRPRSPVGTVATFFLVALSMLTRKYVIIASGLARIAMNPSKSTRSRFTEHAALDAQSSAAGKAVD